MSGITFNFETPDGLVVKMYQPDYAREDLIPVGAVGDFRDKSFTYVWRIEKEFLESQKCISMIELKKIIEKDRLRECAEYYNDNIDIYSSSQYKYSNYKLIKLKKEKGRKRNDWIIEFEFIKKKTDDRGEILEFYNSVLMLPTGEIIIDSSNKTRIKTFIDYSGTLIFYPGSKVVKKNKK